MYRHECNTKNEKDPVAIHHISYDETLDDCNITIVDKEIDKNRRLRLERVLDQSDEHTHTQRTEWEMVDTYHNHSITSPTDSTMDYTGQKDQLTNPSYSCIRYQIRGWCVELWTVCSVLGRDVAQQPNQFTKLYDLL